MNRTLIVHTLYRRILNDCRLFIDITSRTSEDVAPAEIQKDKCIIFDTVGDVEYALAVRGIETRYHLFSKEMRKQ